MPKPIDIRTNCALLKNTYKKTGAFGSGFFVLLV
jgi:hypothetical protein